VYLDFVTLATIIFIINFRHLDKQNKTFHIKGIIIISIILFLCFSLMLAYGLFKGDFDVTAINGGTL
jgi:hypothetical protein